MTLIPKVDPCYPLNGLHSATTPGVSEDDLVSSMVNLTLELQHALEDPETDLTEQDQIISAIFCFANANIQKLPEKLAAKVSKALPTINCLELTRIDELTQEALTLVASQFENLCSLHLSYSTLPFYTPQILGTSTKLACLDLSYCLTAGDPVVRGVSTYCPKLIELRLKGTKISDEVLSSLSQLQELECLDLDFTDISDLGLSKLKSSSINELRLNGCHRRQSDFLTIHKQFDEKHTPTGKLYVPFKAGVTDAGFLKVVENISSLRKVVIFGSSITDAVIAQAKQYSLQRVQVLTVCNFRTFTFKNSETAVDIRPRPFEVIRPKPPETEINYVDRFAQFRGKDFSNPEVVSDVLNFAKGNMQLLLNTMKEEMAAAKCVDRLHIANCLLTSDKLRAIAEHFQNLHQLSFSNVHILDFMDLIAFRKLTDLSLARYPYSGLNTAEFANAITRCAWLENLDISYTDVGEFIFRIILSKKYFNNITLTGCNIPKEVVAEARQFFKGELICPNEEGKESAPKTLAEKPAVLSEVSATPDSVQVSVQNQ
jgi:uncharacterized protein YjbI with pentapeptide repeats